MNININFDVKCQNFSISGTTVILLVVLALFVVIFFVRMRKDKQ